MYAHSWKLKLKSGTFGWGEVFYFLTLACCFLLFQHGDLFYTVSSSYAYIDRHVLDFYSYNASTIGRDDYLPTIYLFFAVWNIPLHLSGLAHNVLQSGVTLNIPEFIWNKLLIALFFCGTAVVVRKISYRISKVGENSKSVSLIFLTSPIAVFAVFIFGQYDIVGLFFTMLGFLFWMKREYIKFSLMFSVAISLKFFPLLLFVPLLLLAEKNLLRLLRNAAIASLVSLVEIGIYFHDSVFRGGVSFLSKEKIGEMHSFSLSGFNNSSYFLLIFLFICLYSYIKEVGTERSRYQTGINLCISAYASLFLTTIWHPQWLILVTPFIALAYNYVQDPKKSLILDSLGMLSFVFLTVNLFPGNVDSVMIQNGILRDFITYVPFTIGQIYRGQLNYVLSGVFYFYLFSPLLVQWFQRIGPRSNPLRKLSKKQIWARFYFGVSLFVLPALSCALVPKAIAVLINPQAYVYPGVSITKSEKVAPQINKDSSVRQSFVAENNNLKAIGVILATYGRSNIGQVVFSLFGPSGELIGSQQLDASHLVDNAMQRFDFHAVERSKGKVFTFEIKSNASVENSITAWMTKSDVYHGGVYYSNAIRSEGELCFIAYYEHF